MWRRCRRDGDAAARPRPNNGKGPPKPPTRSRVGRGGRLWASTGRAAARWRGARREGSEKKKEGKKKKEKIDGAVGCRVASLRETHFFALLFAPLVHLASSAASRSASAAAAFCAAASALRAWPWAFLLVFSAAPPFFAMSTFAWPVSLFRSLPAPVRMLCRVARLLQCAAALRWFAAVLRLPERGADRLTFRCPVHSSRGPGSGWLGLYGRAEIKLGIEKVRAAYCWRGWRGYGVAGCVTACRLHSGVVQMVALCTLERALEGLRPKAGLPNLPGPGSFPTPDG